MIIESRKDDGFYRSRMWFVFRYWIAVIIFFQLARIFFLLQNLKLAEGVGFRTSALTLWHGLIMDISMATYITLPVLLFVILSLFIPFFRRPVLYQVYSGIILLILLFLLVADIAVFKAWGFRLDATPLKYIKSPKEAWASIQHLPLLPGTILFIAAFLILFRGANKMISKGILQSMRPVKKLFSFAILILMLGASIIPIRGGLQLAPINQSTVYFSNDNFANQAALNAPWNLMHSLTHSVKDDVNPYQVMAVDKANGLRDSLFSSGTNMLRLIDSTKTNPNVIVILWEGFTRKVIGKQINGTFITPGYNSLIAEGMYFPNLYATGDRTDKGLVAILSGYPSHPLGSIVKIPAKAAKLPMLNKEFKKRNYHTSFYYGGETEFANMKAYLMQGGFDKIVSVNDFEKSQLNSKWGAHDDVVMKKVLSDLSAARQPYFSAWLTLSSHEPFEVPVPAVFPGTDDESLYFNSLHYSDSVITAFIGILKAQPSWNNTIVVIIPDHGTRMPSTGFKADDFKISMLFLGGALSQKGVISKTGNQVDMAATLSAQLSMEDIYPWSRNLADDSKYQWGFFSFNNGFGYATPEGTVVYDNTGNRIMQTSGVIDTADFEKGRALQQMIYQDYIEK